MHTFSFYKTLDCIVILEHYNVFRFILIPKHFTFSSKMANVFMYKGKVMHRVIGPFITSNVDPSYLTLRGV